MSKLFVTVCANNQYPLIAQAPIYALWSNLNNRKHLVKMLVFAFRLFPFATSESLLMDDDYLLSIRFLYGAFQADLAKEYDQIYPLARGYILCKLAPSLRHHQRVYPQHRPLIDEEKNDPHLLSHQHV